MSQKCADGCRDLRRNPRKGFLQLYVFPIFGYYPWECLYCRKVRMLKLQYERRSHSVPVSG
jgi:hypothetical protein